MINPSEKAIGRKPNSRKTQAGTSRSRKETRPRKPASARSIASARATQPKADAAAPQATTRTTKQDQVAALLLRDEGATLDQMVTATGWLPHTTRAALTGLRKKGYAIDSDKLDGVRTYRAVAPK